MNYKKQNFVNDQILDAAQLNYMEDGIVALYNMIADLTVRIQKLEEGPGEGEVPEGIELLYITCTYNGGDVPVSTNVNDLAGITVNRDDTLQIEDLDS